VQCGGFESEQLSEDGQVRPKHIAVDCVFNAILNEGEIVNRGALKTGVNVQIDTSTQQDAEIQYYILE
jgi:hypothetical protein